MLRSCRFALTTKTDRVCGAAASVALISVVALRGDAVSAALFAAHSSASAAVGDCVAWLATGHPAGIKLTEDLCSFLGRAYAATAALHSRALSAALSRVSSSSPLQLFAALFACTALCAGLSGALRLTADALRVACAPVCVFSAALAEAHRSLSGTVAALWRLFRGRKANPLRRRVDTYNYRPDEMLVGTLAFAVALALWPTLLAFHLLFASLAAAVSAAALLLKACACVVRTFPTRELLAWVALPRGSGPAACIRIDAATAEVRVVRARRPSPAPLVAKIFRTHDLRRWTAAHPPALFARHMLFGTPFTNQQVRTWT